MKKTFTVNLTICPETGRAMLPTRYINSDCTVKVQSLSTLRCTSGVEEIISVPVFLAEIAEYLRSQDWAQGYDGLSTSVVECNTIPAHGCVWVVSKYGAVNYMSHIDSTNPLWHNKLDKKWFLFIKDCNNSKFRYTERIISIAEIGR